MSFQIKQPQSKVILNKYKYNRLMEILYFNLNNGEDKEKIEKLINKIITYGVPRILNDSEEIVDIRFFPSEVNEMLNQLVFNLDPLMESNYYNDLINSKK